MFARLLVGLDGSPGADAALDSAIALGRRFRSTILLAAVTDIQSLEAPFLAAASPSWTEGVSLTGDVAGLDATLRDQAVRLTDAAARKVSAEGLAFEVVHATGLVDEELRRLAERAEAIVVGRRGEVHEGPGTIGKVTAKLVRRSPKPVVVAGDVRSAFARPAVAFDGGTTSTSALALAARYAEATGVPLEVVHVDDNPEAGDALLARAGAFLSETTTRHHLHRLGGSLGPAITEFLDASGADLLVVGAHGGRKRRGWSLGSHAEFLVKATAVPVIVIR